MYMLMSFLTGKGQYADWQQVNCVVPSEKIAVFTSEGASEKKKDVITDAKRRLFYALFYKGVKGINDDEPLVVTENVTITNSFFNASQAYEGYIIEAGEPQNVRKIDGKYHGLCTIHVSIKLLTEFLMAQGVMPNKGEFGSGSGPLMPTIMTIPYTREGESIQRILENNTDMRIAISCIQDGFRSRNVTTYDWNTVLRSKMRRMVYEENKGVVDSNDRQMLYSSGADVIVEVDLTKGTTKAGNYLTLNLNANEAVTGAVLASKSVTTRSFPNATVERLTQYVVRDELQAFLNDVCSVWKKPATNATVGTRVVMEFALLDGGIISSFNDPVGPNNYSLANVIRQWVRKNCYKAQYSAPKIMEEKVTFGTVTMPPADVDGLPMDAGQFAFLLESHLKEQIGVDCSSRIDGNLILFTIH